MAGQKEKTILLVGATGTGKSTLVDGIINYVTGISWNDPYRFTLIDLEKEEKNKNQVIIKDSIVRYAYYDNMKLIQSM